MEGFLSASYVRVLALAACALVGVLKWWSSRQSKAAVLPSVPGPWKYPEPSPHMIFDLAKTEPPHYRAFRYSYKRHTLDVRRLDADSWVILDKDWPMYHATKVKRLAGRGERIVKTLLPAKNAAYELCQDLSEFLSRRYPQVYRIQRSEKDALGWYGKGSITSISMPDLKVTYDLTKEDPLTVAGLIQPADINILIKQSDGFYKLMAMMLGIGGGQRLKDKLDNNLADLHFSGHVPYYATQLQKPLDHFLAKIRPETPIHRFNDWDPKIRGPGVGTPSYGQWKPPGPIKDISQIWFRQERQTLRRLPKSGAVVWMVHTYIEPLATVAQEPGVPGRLASFVRSWGPELAEHKGRHLYEHVLLPYLDDLHKIQVETGVCEDGELPSKFPF